MVGQTVGHYRILQKIGQGGLGDVYLAEDLRLDRKVALKVLADPNPNPDQSGRFEREAKAAAALDHPNILAIHEFGHDGAMPYVVMEFLDGRNLRQRLEQGPLPVRVAVDYALDILAGLAAAHEKGICHRDLKPENVFITRDGRVKILDFGLANIRRSEALLASAPESATREALTRPGVVLGTVGYMAPEQVRGEQADCRADIFAFGAVLFEMLTGRRAFNEPTTVETLNAILKAGPPLSQLSEVRTPAALAQFVCRCLNKRADQRFESAIDAHSTLRSLQTAMAGEPTVPVPTATRRLDSWKEIASYLGRGVRTVQRWEQEEQLPVHRLPHAKRGSVYADRDALDRWWESRRTTLADTATPRVEQTQGPPPVERVTITTAVTLSPALSSDGRMIVYVSDGGDENATLQIWLQQVGGAAMRLTSDMQECAEPTFSADNTRVLFTARGATRLNVYEMPTFGGSPRLLKREAKGARASPDGKWLAYLSLSSPSGVRLGTREGESDRTIAPELMDVSAAVWSTDSTRLLVRGHTDPSFEPDFWIVPIDGRPAVNTGIIQKIRSGGTVLDFPPAWNADSIVFAAATRGGTTLYRQRFRLEPFQLIGDPEPLTRPTEWAAFPAAAAGRLAFFVSSHFDMNLWSISLDRSSGIAHGAPRRLTRGPGILGNLSATADGRTLVYFSARLGKPELFLRDLATGTETVVGAALEGGVNNFPAMSPSATRLAHGVMMPGPRALRPVYLFDLKDGASRQLTADCGGRPRQWIDERFLLIETFGSRLNALAVLDSSDGSVRPLLASSVRTLTNPRVSPDGECVAFDAASPGGWPGVFLASLSSRSPIPESDWILVDDAAGNPFWSADGRFLYYIPTIPNRDFRSTMRGRQYDAASRRPQGDPFVAASLTEAFVPAFLAGSTPVIARDQMVCVLADVRGDIWMTDL